MKTKNLVWKRLQALVLAAGMILGLLAVDPCTVSAAKKLNVKIEKYEKAYKSSDGTVYAYIYYAYPAVSGNSKAAKEINAYFKKEKSKWLKEARRWPKADECSIDNDDISYIDGYEYNYVFCSIETNNGKYLSIMQSSDEGVGMGAHGMADWWSVTFDVKTGKKVTAAKILGISKKALNKKVCNLFAKQYNLTEDAMENLKGINFSNSFYIKDGKLVFYTGPYVLGYFASGEVTIKLK